jgi:hypothetical protein
MRATKRLSGWIGPVCVAVAIVGSGSAFGATPRNPETTAQWQQDLSHLPQLGAGCYQASYPEVQWHATECQVAPAVPMIPAVVGDGKDYSAEVSGTISQAAGSFDDVSPKITEKGQYGDTGSKTANTYSLQLNTEFFSTPTCAKSSDPADCLGWQQFLYDSHANLVFMQYWLIEYKAKCPSGWITDSSDCYKNSPGSKFAGGQIPASGLATTTLVGSAVSGGKDEVSLSNGSGKATLVSNGDSVVHLAKEWNTTEFDVLGDGGGGEAFFGANTTIESQTTLEATSSAAPKCVKEGFTAETNNLNLTHTPAIGSETSPTLVDEQTNATTKTASCAVAAGT